MTRVLAVCSGKGGVGKTTFVANLGSALHLFGKDVVLIDGNLENPNLGLHFGFSKTPTSLHDVLSGKIRMRDAIYVHPSGIKIVPASISFHDSKIKIKRRLVHALMELLGSPDFIIIDGPAGLGPDVKHVLEGSDDVIVVTNPELPAVTDALKITELARECGTSVMGVVVNRYTGNVAYELDPENISEFLEVPLLAVIPEDKHVRYAIHIKRPIIYSFPSTDVSAEYKKLAAKLIGKQYVVKKHEKGLLSKLLEIFSTH